MTLNHFLEVLIPDLHFGLLLRHSVGKISLHSQQFSQSLISLNITKRFEQLSFEESKN
jgi:hypothetical protein